LPAKIIKLNGICKDIDKLTGVNFKFLPHSKEINPPLCCRRETCTAKDFKKQRILCRAIENSTINKFRKSNLKFCRFKCGLSELMLPVFKKASLTGVVFTNKFKGNSRFSSALVSLINRSRMQLVESVNFHRDSIPNKRDNVFIQRAKKFIEKNYHNSRLPLKVLAREVNTSYFHLCRLFKKELNLTFVRYLSLVRLKAALRLLQNLNLNVAQIAYAVGLSDAQYFDRVFKKILHCRPKDYRLSSAAKKERIRRKVLILLERC
jgi:AraC-like DNA-binding protein